MEITMTIKPDPGRLFKNLQGDMPKAQRAGMINALTTVEALAVKTAPKRTSNLARTRTTNVNDDGTRGRLAFTAPYAGYVHEGTGLFGPHHQRIVPVNKRALFWAGAKHPVKSVKGMKGRPWVRKAAGEVNMGKEYSEGMQNYLSQKGY
jgi:hypothetical protein